LDLLERYRAADLHAKRDLHEGPQDRGVLHLESGRADGGSEGVFGALSGLGMRWASRRQAADRHGLEQSRAEGAV